MIFACEIIDVFSIFTSSNPSQILRSLNNIDRKIFHLWHNNQMEAFKHIGLDLHEWKKSVMNELTRQYRFFVGLNFDGPIQRNRILMDIFRKIPSENRINGIDEVLDFAVSLMDIEVIVFKNMHIVTTKHTVDNCVIEVLLGGFIDSFFGEQIKCRKQLKCPFSKSFQNIFGCLNCSGLIDGEGLNHNCSHARRWLE